MTDNTVDNLLDELQVWKDRALKAEYAATHDEMTGVFNRRGLYQEAARRAYKFVYVIDVDGLKRVNDEGGHAAGDMLIKIVVGKLNVMASLGDGVVARVGGDEFVLLVDRLIKTGTEDIDFSSGWVPLENDLDDALRRADARMYVRKAARKSAAKN